MDQAGVDALVALPADVHEIVVALGVVEEVMGVEVFLHAGVVMRCVLLDDLADEGTLEPCGEVILKRGEVDQRRLP